MEELKIECIDDKVFCNGQEVEEVDDEDQIEEVLQSLESDNGISVYNLINSDVSDSIFKSGPFKEWKCARSGDTVYCAYSFEVLEMYTNRPLIATYFLAFDWTRQAESNVFVSQQEIKHNTLVRYYKDTYELIKSDADLKVRVEPKLTMEATDKGIFTYRTQYAQISGSTKNKIAECILEWVPYINSVVWNVQTLRNSEANESKAYKTTEEEQLKYYGQLLRRISAKSSPMDKEGDYILLRLEGKGINKIKFSVAYDLDIY